MTKQEGLFWIKEVLSPVTYHLELPQSWKIYDSFYAGLLFPFKQNDVHGPAYARPSPENIEGHQEYEVDHIKKHRWYWGKKLWFLVHWKGYGDSEDTWEPEENLIHAMNMIWEYKKLHKLEA